MDGLLSLPCCLSPRKKASSAVTAFLRRLYLSLDPAFLRCAGKPSGCFARRRESRWESPPEREQAGPSAGPPEPGRCRCGPTMHGGSPLRAVAPSALFLRALRASFSPLQQGRNLGSPFWLFAKRKRTFDGTGARHTRRRRGAPRVVPAPASSESEAREVWTVRHGLKAFCARGLPPNMASRGGVTGRVRPQDVAPAGLI